MDGVLFPAQLRIDLADFQRKGEVRRLEERGEQRVGGGKQRLAGALLLLRGAAFADAKVEIDEGVFRQAVGDV